MGLGGGIALIAIGLILAFAVNISIAGLDVHLIGLILAGVGLVWLLLFLLVWGPRRRAVETRSVRRTNPTIDPVTGEYIEERRIYDDRP
jgi:hypothetical protein